jgi:hypothetical protein
MLFTMAWSPLNAGAADALDSSSCPKVNPVGVDGKESDASGPRLLELLPEMSGVLDETAFRVSNKWMGLSRLSPAVLEVALALDADRFEGEASVRWRRGKRHFPGDQAQSRCSPRCRAGISVCRAAGAHRGAGL